MVSTQGTRPRKIGLLRQIITINEKRSNKQNLIGKSVLTPGQAIPDTKDINSEQRYDYQVIYCHISKQTWLFYWPKKWLF